MALAGTAAGTFLIIGLKGIAPPPAGPLVAQAGSGTGGGGAVAGAAAATPSAVTLPPGSYTVTGPTEETFFGPVQVQVKVAGGKIVDSSAVQTPNQHGRSIYINEQATPILRQQVLQAQSAAIDGVAGATITSQAYAQSLQAALDKAVAGQHD